MNYLPDILDYNLKIVFIGFNPGLRSAETGHHYAGKSNSFWKLLHQSGITPVRLEPEEDARLPEFGYGSTNIVKRPTRSAAELTPSEFREGAAALKKLLLLYKPRIACYVGIGVYRAFSGQKDISCGVQEQSVVENITDYVCSSPSGLNRLPYDRQLECFKGLQRLAKDL